MAGPHTHEATVEIDGLWFRFQKLRGRRAWRGDRALRTVLGPSAYAVLSKPSFWAATLEVQLQTLDTAEHLKIAAPGSVDLMGTDDLDVIEAAMLELLAYSPEYGGQGVSYRDTAPDPARPGVGWIPIRSLDTLDTYPLVDHLTWRAIRWEMIVLTYRPTTAATGTGAGTRQAMTSTPASGPSGQARQQPSGSPSPAAPPLGMSAG